MRFQCKNLNNQKLSLPKFINLLIDSLLKKGQIKMEIENIWK